MQSSLIRSLKEFQLHLLSFLGKMVLYGETIGSRSLVLLPLPDNSSRATVGRLSSDKIARPHFLAYWGPTLLVHLPEHALIIASRSYYLSLLTIYQGHCSEYHCAFCLLCRVVLPSASHRRILRPDRVHRSIDLFPGSRRSTCCTAYTGLASALYLLLR